MTDGRRAALLGVGAAVAALAWDPTAPAADAKRVALLVAAAVALAAGIAGVGPTRGRNAAPSGVGAPAALWGAFVGWSALSLGWGSPAGVGALGVWGGATGLMIAVAISRGGARRAAGVAGACVGGGSALIALAQAAAGARGFAIHGGHGNPNWLGLTLALALPLAIDLTAALRRAGARSWIAVAALAAVEVPALVLSRSRVAWAATLLTLGVWAIAAASRRRRKWIGRARAVLASVIAAAALAGAALVGARAAAFFSSGAAAPFSAHAVASSAQSAADDGDARAPGSTDVPLAAAWEGRVWIWRASADAALAALPFGVGLGDFAAAYLDAQGERLAPLRPPEASRRFLNATTAHNDWLQAAAEGGAPGLALLLAAIAAGLTAAARARWAGGAAALVAFAICAAGDSPLHQPAAATLLALTLAGATSSTSDHPSARAPRRGARRPLALCAATLAAVALLLAAATRSWITSRWLHAARDAEPAARIARLERAARLDPWSGEAALALGIARLELGDAAGALTALERSRALLANVGTDVAIGNALLAHHAPERAAAAYDRALRRHPGSLRAHANRVEALTRLGQLDQAERHLAAARSISPGHPRLPAIAERLRRARIDAAALGED